MKRISLLAATILFAVSCSSDDDAPVAQCNCQKVISTYNEEQQVFMPVSSEFYSNNCADETNGHQPNEDGTFWRINCTPQ